MIAACKKEKGNKTKLFKDDVEKTINDLKQKSTRDIFIFGSADLSHILRKLNLIDEYRIMINPVLLGQGVPLFKENNLGQKLKLVKTRVFDSGNILLIYQPN